MLPAQLGTGGNNTPFVVEGHTDEIYCIDGDKIGKAERAGGSGLGIRDGDKMYTLTAKDAGTHSVAYSIGNGQLNQITMAEQANTLDCMHDQQAVLYQNVIGALCSTDYKWVQQQQVEQDKLIVEQQGDIAGVDCWNYTESDINGSLQASGGHNINSNNVVRVRYIVRRLTPTECARLQGFADRWAVPDPKDDFTDDEYEFWCKVNLDYDRVFEKARPNEDGWYNVWREVKPNKAKGEDFEPYWEDTGKPYTHKTLVQMLKWYNNLWTDSNEYKLWGNGIAFPNALYVMQGIADAINQ